MWDVTRGGSRGDDDAGAGDWELVTADGGSIDASKEALKLRRKGVGVSIVPGAGLAGGTGGHCGLLVDGRHGDVRDDAETKLGWGHDAGS